MKTTEVRITDPYVIKVIESHRQARGQRSRTATAGDMILERNAQLESKANDGRGTEAGKDTEKDSDASVPGH